jgi:hypothetical protein
VPIANPKANARKFAILKKDPSSRLLLARSQITNSKNAMIGVRYLIPLAIK